MIVKQWSRSFAPAQIRRATIRRAMRANLHCQPAGKGNAAWKRVEALDRDTDSIVWPNYLRTIQ